MSDTQKPARVTGHEDVTKLTDMLMQLDDLLVTCMRCGLCQSVCPVYGATLREADVTRGKISLLENLAKKITEDAHGVDERLNRCLLCGSCEANCPSGVKIMDIFMHARSIIAGYFGLSPVKKVIFKGMLTHPRLFNSLLDISSKFQGLFLRGANKDVGTSCAPLLNPIIGARHFPALAKTPLHKAVQKLDTPAGHSGIKVALFPGCVTDKLFPNVGKATLKVLAKHGVGVYLPSEQACCGIPAIASGDMPSYHKLAKMNAAIFAQGEFDYLLTPCATCASTIKEVWPMMIDDHYTTAERRSIEAWHGKTLDITQFLVDVLKVQLPADGDRRKRVTYHDSCHMRNSLKSRAQPRALLSNMPGYSFVEMPEADRCCGSGGSFCLYHYDLSKQIGQRKRNNIVSVDPDVVTATCPACMMQMMDMLSQNNDNIQVKHVIELYADSL